MSIQLTEVSEALATLVESTAPSVVRVEAEGPPVSGTSWGDGTVVTVAHAIESDGPVTLTLADGTQLSARLVGRDPRLDLAFLQLPEEHADLIGARPAFAESSPRTGHLVVTLGRGPRGLRSSLGIVGAVHASPWRTRGGAEVSSDIDVDATLHPTAAGGPLLDASGRLLGINTTGIRPGGATLPVDTVDAALALVRDKGSIRPGLLGVRVRTTPLPPDLAATHGQHQGLLVLGTPRRGPAHKAGIESGDVILRVADTPVHTLLDLRAALSTSGGQEVSVTLLRSGEVRECRVLVRDAPFGKGGRSRWGGHHKGGRHHRGHGGPWRRWRKAHARGRHRY